MEMNIDRIAHVFTIASSACRLHVDDSCSVSQFSCITLVFQLSVKGYNHKQPVLLRKILERMTDFQLDPKRFPVIKERVSAWGTRIQLCMAK